jgi:hypothetical protein
VLGGRTRTSLEAMKLQFVRHYRLLSDRTRSGRKSDEVTPFLGAVYKGTRSKGQIQPPKRPTILTALDATPVCSYNVATAPRIRR